MQKVDFFCEHRHFVCMHRVLCRHPPPKKKKKTGRLKRLLLTTTFSLLFFSRKCFTHARRRRRAQGMDFPVHGDNLRYTSWNEDHKDEQGRKVDAQGKILIHPEPLSFSSFEEIRVKSGQKGQAKGSLLFWSPAYSSIMYHGRY